MRTIIAAVYYAVIAAIGVIAAGIAARPAGQRLEPEDLLRGAAVLAVAVLVATLGAAAVERRSVSTYGLTLQPSSRPFLIGAVAACVILSAFALILVAEHLFIVQGRLLDNGSALRSGTMLLATFGLRAFAIEVAVHGYALSFARRTLSTPVALVLTAIAFGFGAVVAPEVTPSAVIILCMAGFCLGTIALSSGTTWYGIGFLTTWMWEERFVLGSPPNYAVAHARFVNSVLSNNDFATGGTLGFEASAWMLLPASVGVVAALVHLTLAREAKAKERAISRANSM
ncbi:MAG: hypothetical protein JO036_09575 [Candidatus Eremiobacteraeota bacterium]|nr:hypothetical protein [Candidatus Eremiobacteraeota bacterium]